MLDLSPTKLIIIFIVVVVLLGPKRLPEVARQLGAGWRKLRDLHGQLDRELRQAMPDLPSSQDIVRFARSPITLLNQLADQPGESPSSPSSPSSLSQNGAQGAATPDATAGGGGATLNGAEPNRVPLNGSGRAARGEGGGGGGSAGAVPWLAGLDTDDPNLN